MTRSTGRFRRAERILRPREYREHSRRAERRSNAAFVVLSAPTASPEVSARLGLAVGRRVGNAVVRNRVKRRIREWFRTDGRFGVAEGRDLVVIARQKAASLSHQVLGESLEKLLRSSR